MININRVNGKLVIKPYGGLANRMRAVDSAFLLAQRLNYVLKIIWERSFELNCQFVRLFKIPESVEIKEYYRNGIFKRIYDFTNRNCKHLGMYFPSGFNKYLYNDDIEKILRQDNSNILSEISGYKSVYIFTVNQFYRNKDSFKVFEPVPELKGVIDKYLEKYNDHTIGVHIRRTDNKKSIKHSPIEGFIKSMEQEISKNSDSNFFLATDSVETEIEICKKFGERVISHVKNLNRNSERGIQDALIDLYCLANSSKIIGSFHSSFSEVAAQINKKELIQIYE